MTITYRCSGATSFLKLSGDENWAVEVEVPYSDVGDDFFGAEPSLEFDLEPSAVGQYITLTASGSPFGEFVTASKLILVEATPDPVITFEIIAVVAGDEDRVRTPAEPYFFNGAIVLSKLIGHPMFPSEVSSYQQASFSNDGDAFFPDEKEWTNWENIGSGCGEMVITGVDGEEGDNDNSVAITVNDLEDGTAANDDTYYVSITQQHTRVAECYIAVVITTYEDGEVKQTETYNRTNTTGSYTFTTDFATINSETGVITMLDPPVTTFV